MNKALLGLLCGLLLTTTLTLAKDIGVIRIYTADLFILPFLILSFINVIAGDGRFRFTPIDHLLLTAMAIITLSFSIGFISPYSDDPHSIAGAVNSYLGWIRVFLVYLAARSLTVNYLGAQKLSTFMMLLGMVLVTIGLIQWITNSPIGLVANYFGVNVDQAGETGFLSGKMRVSGTTPNSNLYGIWINLFTSVFAAFFLTNKKWILFGLLEAIVFFVVLSSASRGAFLCFLLGSIVMVTLHFFSSDSRQRFVIVFISVFSGLTLLAVLVVDTPISDFLFKSLEPVTDRHAANMENEEEGRLELIEYGIDALTKRPRLILFGTGGQPMLVDVGGSYPILVKIHNFWVLVSVEYGLLSSVLFLLIFWKILRICYKKFRSDGENVDFCCLALLSFLVPFLLVASNVYEISTQFHVLIPILVLFSSVYVFCNPLKPNLPTISALNSVA